MPRRRRLEDAVGRLAFRVEGELWCAYHARRDTMDGAVLLGAIRMVLVVGQPQRKTAFMQLMQACMADVLADTCGLRPIWGEPQGAPESERGGNA